MLTWDKTDERYFQTGIDRGVLYPTSGDPVVWNGITGVDDGGNGSHEVSYLDGKIFLADSDATDYSGKLTAFDFPDEFMVCIGMPQVVDGLILDNQKPKRFGLSYRSLIGSGLTGDQFGYQIHLVYNAFASIGATSRKTISNTASPIEFAFDLVATPVKLAGYRPTAHYILDTRRLDPETIASLEGILYGSGVTPGRLPTPTELFEMLNFGPNIDVTYNTTDETINFAGQRSNVFMTGTDSFQINNVNAVDNGDGTYTISDGGTTTVTVV